MASDKSLKKSTRARNPQADDARDPRAVADYSRSAGADERAEHREQLGEAFAEWTQEALPRIPDIPGFHTCWLSTTNQWDPIHKRMRMGYSPIRAEEVPGLAAYKVHSGEHSGFVAVNEMLAFKIPLELYQSIMREFHHERPRQEEEAIRSRMEGLVETTIDSKGQKLITEEQGNSGLGKHVRAPVFS